MQKFFIISLSLLIVILSFAVCFADTGSPVILPVTEDGLTGLNINFGNNVIRTYSATDSPVYLCFANINGTNRIFVFSENPNSVVFYNNNSTVTEWSMQYEYNGYYYATSSTFNIENTPYYVGEFSSYYDLIDTIDNSVFSTTFDLTSLVDGSISWLSTFAQAVKNSPLLLFFVVFIFVGIGIGLLNRFRRG